jgi:penicillin V acylase-like amidase (Ntn superfamily)
MMVQMYYTQYQAVMNVSKIIYYFNPYHTRKVFSVDFGEKFLNLKQSKELDNDFVLQNYIFYIFLN